MRRFLATVLAWAMVVPAVSALPSLRDALPHLTDEQYETLARGQTLKLRSTHDEDISVMAPMESNAYQFTVEGASRLGEGFNVAVSRLVPYPADWADETQQERQVEIFNRLRQISTIQGITYISHRAGDKEKVLFNKTYSLEDPDDRKTKYADPVVSEVPATLKAYAYLNDTTFDGLVYDIDYQCSENEIFMNMTNHVAMRFKGIKVLDARKLSMSVSAFQLEDGIYLYAMANVFDQKPEVKILFWNVYLASSFQRRMEALLNWFQNRVSISLGSK